MRYTATWNNPVEVWVEGFEAPLHLPDMPPNEQMVNYGLPLAEQKFCRTHVPLDIGLWERDKVAQFVEGEWHKRLNGIWVLVKEQPIYITGTAYVFFNYWTKEDGGRPDFRMEAVEFYWIWLNAERDRNCFGLVDIKARRLGDTEKALCAGWELCTRYRKSEFGMQHMNADEVRDNFQRVCIGNRDMVFFFKPRVSGDEMPARVLNWRYPLATNTHNSDQDARKFGFRYELGGRVSWRPTKEKAYDGKRLRFYHLDEAGKIEVSKMDCYKQWEVVRPMLLKRGLKKIVGKAFVTTTVEETLNGDTVEVMRKFWDSSDPTQKDENGRTLSGLWRLFRGYLYGADTDEWGFPMKEEAMNFRKVEIAKYEKAKDWAGLSRFKRKYPASIEESLVPPDTDCILYPELLDQQIARLNSYLLTGEYHDRLPVRGNLEWRMGIGSDVVWVPNEKGRWQITQHPDKPNAKVSLNGERMPGNTPYYCAGIDPIDAFARPKADGDPNESLSRGAIAVMSLLNLDLEGDLVAVDEQGQVENPALMRTGQCVCLYLHRPFDPKDFFDDVCKTLHYYGCVGSIENQKGSALKSFMIDYAYRGYMARTRDTGTSVKMKVQRSRSVTNADFGANANDETIRTYVQYIQSHIAIYHRTYWFLDLLQDMRFFSGEKKNRTKRDATVAWGLSLSLALNQSQVARQRKRGSRERTVPFRYNLR